MGEQVVKNEIKALQVLDVGCGTGEMRAFLYSYRLPKGYTRHYTGIDGDPLKLQRARAYTPSGDFREMILPGGVDTLEKNHFNVITCSEVYEHLVKEDGEQLLLKLHQTVAPGCIAVFTVPTLKYRNHRPNPLHPNEMDPEDFMATARAAGWNVVNWYWLHVPFLRPKFSRIPPEEQQTAEIVSDGKHKGTRGLYILQK